MQEMATTALRISSRVRKTNHAFLIQQKAFAARKFPSRVRNPVGVDRKTLFSTGSVLAGLGAAATCAVPLILLSLGISGAWIGNFNALYPYKPHLVATALVLLAGGLVTLYGPLKAASGEAATADRTKFAARFNKTALWVSTALIGVAIGLPCTAPW